MKPHGDGTAIVGGRHGGMDGMSAVKEEEIEQELAMLAGLDAEPPTPKQEPKTQNVRCPKCDEVRVVPWPERHVHTCPACRHNEDYRNGDCGALTIHHSHRRAGNIGERERG